MPNNNLGTLSVYVTTKELVGEDNIVTDTKVCSFYYVGREDSAQLARDYLSTHEHLKRRYVTGAYATWEQCPERVFNIITDR